MVRITPQRRVVCERTVSLPLSAITAWGQLRDFRTYASHDQFHSGLSIDGGVPRAGARLVIEHRFLGLRTMRHGRILFWREGVGYAFSDLSERGLRRGFPHVLSMTLQPNGPSGSTLRVRVTGLWTAPGPRWVGRLWLAWVLSHIVRGVRNRLLWFALARKVGGATAR